MTDGITIEIKGMDELIKKLTDLSKLSKVHAGLKAGMLHLKGKIATYPPETAANQPGSGSWYQRGWGTRYAGGGGKMTSESLGRKWATKYDKNKYEGEVGNNASYALFVNWTEGTQAKALKGIGWQGVDVVAKEETKRVGEYVFEAVRRAIGA